MREPAWLLEALKYRGVAEIPGPKNSPVIAGWLHRLRAWWEDDETPWCGVFVAACMDAVGVELPKNWMRAKAWADWGSPLANPALGCVVVFERPGGGHVGLVVGRDALGRLVVLGGNQGNRVSLAPFDRQRVIAYRWPTAQPAPTPAPLPMISSAAPSSQNEA